MDHQSKKKNQVSISSGRGGGGIAGLLVFGGALAVSGLIAVASFASNKNKAERPKTPVGEPEPQESDDTTEGLPSLLQDSTTNDENAWYTQIFILSLPPFQESLSISFACVDT